MLVGDNDAIRTLNTCIAVAYDIYQCDGLASFGFIGMNSYDEDSKENTKRYRIYKIYATTYFSLENFEHKRDDKNSVYLLLNRKNKHITSELVNIKMNELYIMQSQS